MYEFSKYKWPKVNLIVFHPYYGCLPAFCSSPDVEYPILAIYDNIDRYYGIKSIIVSVCEEIGLSF